jgi:hypothetical protein
MSIAQSTLNAALVAALSDMRNIAKDKVNPHFRSKFTSLDAILETVRPIMAKHGLAITQLPEFRDGLAGVTTRIIHKSGESTESTLLLPLKDQSAQGVGSALTYARRYSISAVCGIASDEDEDGQQASTPAKKTITQPVIPKPRFQPRNEVAALEEAKTAVLDQWQVMFESMEKHKISEAMLGSFLISKNLDVPDFLADLPLPVVKRINQKFDDIVAFSAKLNS